MQRHSGREADEAAENHAPALPLLKKGPGNTLKAKTDSDVANKGSPRRKSRSRHRTEKARKAKEDDAENVQPAMCSQENQKL